MQRGRDQSTSELSSPQASPSRNSQGHLGNGHQMYAEDRHRNNPLFRSDAFEQIPSQHQVLS